MTQAQAHLEAESVAQLLARAYEQGWTDGLPSIPATPETVPQFIAASGRAADELIGLPPPRKGRATVEVIAVNAIMAGCRPEYMPVIIAAGRGDANTVWRARSPGEVYLTVAGGPGPQDVYIGAGMPQTRLIRGV